MKNINKIISFALLCLMSLTYIACSNDDGDFANVSTTAVKELYNPSDNDIVDVQSTNNVYFEWENAYSSDNSVVYYEVLFDLPTGDFSDPIYRVASDANGFATGATVDQSTLNQIATLGGAAAGESIQLKWSVRSGRGINFTMGETSRNITLIRMVSVDELSPEESLYITGTGVEDDQQFAALETSGQYQIWTKMDAGAEFHLYSTDGSEVRNFEIISEGENFLESDDAQNYTIANAGVYRITLDFESASCVIEEVSKVEWFFMYSGDRHELTYDSNGTWKGLAVGVDYPATSWGTDERYKFIFTLADGTEEHWGQLNWSDSRPDIDDAASRYLYYIGNDLGDWDGNVFKMPDALVDEDDFHIDTDIVLTMNAEQPFTHEFENYTL